MANPNCEGDEYVIPIPKTECIGNSLVTINNNFRNLDIAVCDIVSAPPPVPVGVIVMWSGSIANIPEGWALCNGTNGTPDLTDRFIVGAGRAYTVGNKGGADSITLSINQMPAHAHTGTGSGSTNSTGAHTHTQGGGGSFDDGGPNVPGSTSGGTLTNISSNGNHSHTVAVTLALNNAGGGQAHENRPPYYALAYIMKA